MNALRNGTLVPLAETNEIKLRNAVVGENCKLCIELDDIGVLRVVIEQTNPNKKTSRSFVGSVNFPTDLAFFDCDIAAHGLARCRTHYLAAEAVFSLGAVPGTITCMVNGACSRATVPKELEKYLHRT